MKGAWVPPGDQGSECPAAADAESERLEPGARQTFGLRFFCARSNVGRAQRGLRSQAVRRVADEADVERRGPGRHARGSVEHVAAARQAALDRALLAMQLSRMGIGSKWSETRWLASTALLLLGCEDHACLDYGCLNQIRLHGSVAVPSDVSTIDADYCEESRCQSVRLDLAANQPCDSYADGVCLSGTGEARELTVIWNRNGAPRPQNKSLSIKLVDHDSGRVLLDEARLMTGRVGDQLDDCHQDCWTAEAQL